MYITDQGGSSEVSTLSASLISQGVLDGRGTQSLSRLIFYVFIPSLTFTKLGASVDLHNMGRWWILPVNVFISICIGMVIGWLCSRLLKAPKKLRPHIICCIATGNVGNLPIVLVAALCEDQSSAVAHAVAPGRCYELGIAYVVFAMWVAGLFQFSVAYALLKPSPETLEEKEGGLPVVLHERPGHLMLTSAFHDLTDLARLELQPLRSTLSSSEPEEAVPGHDAPGHALNQNGRHPGVLEPFDSAAPSRGQDAGKERYQQGRLHNGYNALQNGRNDSAADFGIAHAHGSSAASSLAVSTCGSEESELLSIREHGPDQAKHGHSLAEGVPDQEGNTHNSSSSCAVGSSSASVSKHDSARPPDAKHDSSSSIAATQSRQQGCQPYTRSNSRLPGKVQRQSLSERCRGAARWFKSVPWSQIINMPILAAFAGLTFGCVPFLKGLLFGPEAPLGFIKDCLELLGMPMIPCMMMVLGAVLHKGPGSVNVAPRLIVGVSAFRLIIIPLAGTAALLLLRKAGVFDPPDALFMLVLFLGHATPTAINVQTIATIHQNGEAEVSCILFWQYIASIISLPLLLLLFFQLI
ncbi:g5851 [Coccomyxa viridis]|uniref:G5851 protein n=1 Tax=Coccomyxa viridis TaxID=1274662 RepID=A0ABP1G0I1_9CHLO